MSTIKELIRQYSGQHNTVTFQRPYVEFTGSVDGALLLGQLIYWSDKGDEEGWFYKSYMDWQNEIYVKERSARSIAQGFESQGFLEIQKRRTPSGTPKMHYRFLLDRFAIVFEDFLKAQNPDADGLGNYAGTIQRNKKTGEGTAKVSERSGRSAESETADLPNQPYIQLITNKLITNNQENPECVRKELFCDELQTIDISEGKDFGMKELCPVVKKAANLNGEGEIFCEDDLSVASQKLPAAIQRTENALDRQLIRQYIDPEAYGSFRGLYVGFAEQVSKTGFGSDRAMQAAWSNLARSGWSPDKGFWDGLSIDIADGMARYQSGGCVKLAGIPGGALWISERRWERAIGRRSTNEAMRSVGLAHVQPTSKESELLRAKEIQKTVMDELRRERDKQLAIEVSCEF